MRRIEKCDKIQEIKWKQNYNRCGGHTYCWKVGLPLENTTFKTVTFGGFDKGDVANYIQKSAAQAEEVQRQLSKEIEALEQELAQLKAEHQTLAEQSAQQMAEKDQALADCQAVSGQQLSTLREQLQGQINVLTPDAQAYQRFCQSMTALELEAKTRASDLEAQAMAKMEAQEQAQTERLAAMEGEVTQRLADLEAQTTQRLAQEQAESDELVAKTHAVLHAEVAQACKHYKQLSADFSNVSMAISAQLRSMDVSVLHAPQALEQVGGQLQALERSVRQATQTSQEEET